MLPLAIPAITAGLSMLPGLFGGGDKKDKSVANEEMDLLRGSSAHLRNEAGVMQGMGTQALAPVLDYFKSVLGGNPQALLEATAPERGRVIDQYDTARQAIAEFSPRGGGQTSALAESRISEAGQLADVMTTAKRDALGGAAQLGTQLTGLGLTAEQLASSDLNAVIDAALTKEGFNVQKRGQNMEALSGLGQALGQLAGIWMTRDKGPRQQPGGVWGGTT